MVNRSSPRGKSSANVPSRATPSRTQRSLHDDVTAAIRTLGIALTAEALDAALSAAETEALSHLEFVHRLLAGPAEAKLQRALERRVRAANESQPPRSERPRASSARSGRAPLGVLP